jgi:hypothetical protein
MRERGSFPRVFEKPGVALSIGEEILSHHPQRDRSPMRRIACAIQLADATGANPFEDSVMPKRLEH